MSMGKMLIYTTPYGKNGLWGRIENDCVYMSEYGKQDFVYHIEHHNGEDFIYRGWGHTDLLYRTVHKDGKIYVYHKMDSKNLAYVVRSNNCLYTREFGNDSFVGRLEYHT